MRTKDHLRTVEQERAIFHGLRVAVVAERLSCTPAHVLELIRQKKLPAVNIGLGRKPDYRVDQKQLERFLAERAA